MFILFNLMAKCVSDNANIGQEQKEIILNI